MFAFAEASICDRIFENQPWNFRGAIVLLDHIISDECPSTLSIHSVPFWFQVHGLQLWAMNRAIGQEIGALLGKLIEVSCDAEGAALGKCIRVKAYVDVLKPLTHWTNVNIGGSSSR